MNYIPDRGDFVWLQFYPQAGHEQSGRRPALVLSPKSYNDAAGLAIVCPITSQVKGYPFEVRIPRDATISGVVLADHVRSVDWLAREASYIGSATESVLSDVKQRLTLLI